MNRVEIGRRLRKLREEQGLSRVNVADLIEIGTTTLQQWETGSREASIETIGKLAKLYKSDPQTIIFGSTDAGDIDSQLPHDKPANEYVNIPAYDIKASAGHGMFSEGTRDSDRHLAFRKRWITSKGLEAEKLAVLFTEGDSMTPTVPEGAHIVIDRTKNKAMDGKVYVIRIDDRLYVKRTQWLIGGGLRLISDNKQYDALDITPNDMEAGSIEVCGQVIHAAYDLPD